MNRLLQYLIILAPLICGENRTVGQTEWNLVAPFPPRLGAYFAVSVGNRAYFWTNNNTVYSTPDGGNTFTVSQYAPIANIALGDAGQSLAFIDSLTGFVSDAAYGEFKTSDGGTSWQKMIEPSNLEGSILVFGSKQVGWRFAGYGSYKSTDGGNTWQYNNVPQWLGGIPSRAFALDEKRVWVTRNYASSDHIEGAIWYSGDGGYSWTQLSNAPFSKDSTEIRYQDIQFLSNGVGLALGTSTTHLTSDTKNFLSRTTDFGNSWMTTELSGESPTSVLALDDSVWLVFGSTGQTRYCRRSTDNGLSWITQPTILSTQSNEIFYAATYVQNLHCVLAVCISGVYRSWDGGSTFSRLTSDRDFYINDVTVEHNHIGPGPPILLAYGPGASLLISEDNGLTWQQKTIPAKDNIYSISRARIAGDVIYAMINQTMLFKSTDKGNTWTLLYTPNQGGQQGLEAFDANTIAVNGYPYMLSTTDGGNTWLTPPFPGSCWVNDISMINAKTISAAGFYEDTSGTRGMFYQTTDAGYNWHVVDLPQEIKHIRRISNSIIYAHGVYGVYKSLNGGNTWTTIRTSNDYYTYYTNFIFRDSLYGLLKEAYYFLQTTDGGKSWNSSTFSVPFYLGPDAIERASDGRFLAVGEGKLFIQKDPLSDWRISTSTMNADHGVMVNYELLNAYPDPFNPSTIIQFTVPTNGWAVLKVFNVLGQEVATLFDGEATAGTNHQIVFNGSSLASGIYFSRLEFGGKMQVKKMMLLK